MSTFEVHQFETYLEQLCRGNVRSITIAGDGLEGILDFLARLNVLRDTADHEGHELFHADIAITEKISKKKNWDQYIWPFQVSI